MCFVLFTRPTICILDQYIRKQDFLFVRIQMVGLSGFQMAFEYQTIWHPATIRQLEYRTRSVFIPHYIWILNLQLFLVLPGLSITWYKSRNGTIRSQSQIQKYLRPNDKFKQMWFMGIELCALGV